MKIEISCIGLDSTPAFSEYVEEKISGATDVVQRFEKDGELTAYFKIIRTSKHHAHGDVYDGEVMLQLPGKSIHLKKSGSDPRAVVDEIKDELKVELRKYKEKATSNIIRKDKAVS